MPDPLVGEPARESADPFRKMNDTRPGLQRRVRRWEWWVAGGAVVVIAAIIGLATGVFAGHRGRSGGVSDNSYPTSTTTVNQGSLSSQLSADGTLEYTTPDGSDYTVVNHAAGTFSELPSAGAVISRGQVLYRVSNDPVILLYGDTPVYRSLYEGDSGPDVRELNRNLVALGYATRADLGPDSKYFSAETAYALERLQYRLGEDETGSLTDSNAVFLPGRARITTVSATLGTTAAPGLPIARASSTSRDVLVHLDASDQTEVAVGDKAQITLPAGQTTPGVISAVGSVASQGSSGPTLPVYITLEHPQAAGTLERAPVQIEITTSSVHRALIVPVNALLARAGGHYAVEEDSHGMHRLVAVNTGLFDDADGLVQIRGDRLAAGQRVVVPGS
jgi:peptidoglycan hydrolase-like protein with peptidoglycan-binding domain